MAIPDWLISQLVEPRATVIMTAQWFPRVEPSFEGVKGACLFASQRFFPYINPTIHLKEIITFYHWLMSLNRALDQFLAVSRHQENPSNPMDNSNTGSSNNAPPHEGADPSNIPLMPFMGEIFDIICQPQLELVYRTL